MAIRSSTSTLVRLNAKIESVNFIKLPSPADGTVIADGRFIVFNSSGNAALADTSSRVAYLNFSPGNRSDISDVQNDPIAEYAANINIDTGGLSGIIGNGTMIGLPKSSWSDPAASFAIGQLVESDSVGKPKAVAATAVNTGSTALTTGNVTLSFGSVAKIEGSIVWFIFNSVANMVAG